MTDNNHAVFMNPYTDFGFKKLFGTEPNKDLLISFLNALFEGDRKPIVDLRETARKMRSMGMDMETVLEVTGLPKEELSQNVEPPKSVR